MGREERKEGRGAEGLTEEKEEEEEEEGGKKAVKLIFCA